VAEVQEWADGFEEIWELIGPRFSRTEPRDNVVAYLKGLRSTAERNNSWTLSERAGLGIADGMQRLLSIPDRESDALRDDLRLRCPALRFR
jgi:hypothetical protein